MNADAAALERSRRLVLWQLMARAARRVPERDALIFGGERRTFAQLEQRSARVAAALAARGVGRGDHVAVMLYNRLELVETLFGCQRIGACPVPVNFRLVQDEIDFILEDASVVGVVSDEPLAERAAAAVHKLGLRFHLAVGDEYERALAGAPPVADAIVTEDDLAFLMYTSGTTGRPKGAMLSQGNLVANTLNWVHEIGATADDVWLSGLPLFHIGGLNGLLPFLYLGATQVITASTGFDAGESIELLRRHRATMAFFVPTQWRDICRHPDVGTLDAERLKVAMWGASPATREVLELLRDTFPRAGVVSAFGQTEMSSNTAFLKGADSTRKMGSVGRPAINVDVRVVDDAGQDVARGEVGEIVYRGPTVMLGYHRRPEATAEAFAGGWLHSGDLVREDDEGYLWVVDRKKDMIVSGGENVYPAEIERVLETHPAVAEVAVVGVPDPRWVETPVAVVVSRDEVTEEELIAHCRERLAGYKKPSAVVFVPSLPRNAAGKVLKRLLREQVRAPEEVR
jgi:acyl-CoA synthetase (AMP-forming)/AMP-acid ligase II